MYRAYIHYLTGKRAKDFNSKEKAVLYAKKILSKNHTIKIIIEDIENCKIVFEEYAK